MNRKLSKLIGAIENADVEKAKSLLKPSLFGQRVNVNELAYMGRTVLMTAAERGNVEMIRLLIAAGADVNARGSDYGTALFVAIKNGHSEIVRSLMDAGAVSEAPLTLAAEYGQDKVVKLMLERGCDVNHRNSRGETALMFALKRGDRQLIKLLVDAGAEMNLSEIIYQLASSPTRADFQAEIIGYFIEVGADVNAITGPTHFDRRKESSPRPTVLMAAVDLHSLPIIQLLVESGADVNGRDDNGETVLFYLANYGFAKEDISILEYLCQKGLRVNETNYSGKHPRIAATQDLLAFSKSLFNAGAQYMPADSHVLLVGAVDNNDPELLRHLLERGAEIEWEEEQNGEDEWGRVSSYRKFSLITYARSKGSVGSLQLLEQSSSLGK
jgi:uncharacterized protein